VQDRTQHSKILSYKKSENINIMVEAAQCVEFQDPRRTFKGKTMFLGSPALVARSTSCALCCAAMLHAQPAWPSLALFLDF
jgi:hypothetical protein